MLCVLVTHTPSLDLHLIAEDPKGISSCDTGDLSQPLRKLWGEMRSTCFLMTPCFRTKGISLPLFLSREAKWEIPSLCPCTGDMGSCRVASWVVTEI